MKMKPDRTDYETWIVDYLDGNLDEDQVGKLFSFLKDNPDIMEEFNELQLLPNNAAGVEFHDKNSLKKSVHQLSETQFEQLCVAHLENDISPEQQYELQEIVSADAERNKTFELISKTRLVPPPVTYPYKKSLYRMPVFVKAVRIAAAVTGIAATLLILVTLLFNRPEIITPETGIAAAESSPEPGLTDTGIDAPAIMEKNTIPVPEKSPEPAVSMQTLAKNNIPAAILNDSVIKERLPEVRKAEFRQEVALASFSEPAGLTVAQGTNTIVTDYYAAEPLEENRSVARMIRDRIRMPEQAEKEKITAFDVADAGINGLNRLFGWDISLEKNRDDNGTVKSVNFNSKLIKVSAPVRKSEPVE